MSQAQLLIVLGAAESAALSDGSFEAVTVDGSADALLQVAAGAQVGTLLSEPAIDAQVGSSPKCR